MTQEVHASIEAVRSQEINLVQDLGTAQCRQEAEGSKGKEARHLESLCQESTDGETKQYCRQKYLCAQFMFTLEVDQVQSIIEDYLQGYLKSRS